MPIGARDRRPATGCPPGRRRVEPRRASRCRGALPPAGCRSDRGEPGARPAVRSGRRPRTEPPGLPASGSSSRVGHPRGAHSSSFRVTPGVTERLGDRLTLLEDPEAAAVDSDGDSTDAHPSPHRAHFVERSGADRTRRRAAPTRRPVPRPTRSGVCSSTTSPERRSGWRRSPDRERGGTALRLLHVGTWTPGSYDGSHARRRGVSSL